MFGCLLAAFGMALMPAAAMAQDSWASRDYEFAIRQLNDFTSRFERDLVDPVQRGVRAGKPGAAAPRTAGGAPDANAAGTTVVPSRSPQLPRQMAAAYPADQRAAVQRTFEELLGG